MAEFEQTSLANLNIVRQITNSLGGGTTKTLGQNFLINQNSLYKFVDSIHVDKNDYIIEIGPGIGVISYTLCQKARKVYLIEIDKDKEPALRKSLENFNNYEIIWADAVSFNYKNLETEILKNHKDSIPPVIKIIGSLPYNVGKRIIYNFFIQDFNWTEAAFFLQREVAESYTSLPPRAEFLSLHAQIFADTKFAFGIPAEHFFPIPKVKTGVIYLSKHDKYKDIDKVEFSRFIKQGFTNPRKTILNNLKTFKIAAEDLESLNIKPNLRPSELKIEDWLKIFSFFNKQSKI